MRHTTSIQYLQQYYSVYIHSLLSDEHIIILELSLVIDYYVLYFYNLLDLQAYQHTLIKIWIFCVTFDY